MTTYASDLPDIVVSNNADYEEAHDVMDGDQPLDLTGCSVRMQLRATPTDSRAYLDLSSPSGGATINLAEMSIALRAPVTVMQIVPAGDYVRDILILKGDQTLFAGRGKVTVVAGITR